MPETRAGLPDGEGTPDLKTAYLTGSSGFIGKHLAAALMSKRSVITLPHERLETTTLERFDEFYFLSSYGNLYHQTDHNEILNANISQLLSILRQVDVNSSFDSFVFLSSSSVDLKTQSVYSRAKRAAEEIIMALAERYTLPMVIARPFSVTGVGEQSQHLIPTLIRSCFTGSPVDLAPEPTHDFIDVDDVVSGIITLAEAGAAGIFELGSGKEYANIEVLELVERLSGRHANITLVDSLRPYDTTGWVSTGRSARDYGWRPAKSLEQSIMEMIKRFQDENRAE